MGKGQILVYSTVLRPQIWMSFMDNVNTWFLLLAVQAVRLIIKMLRLCFTINKFFANY